MGKSGKIITALIVVALVVGGVLYFAGKKDDKTSKSTNTDSSTNNNANKEEDSEAADVTITYDGEKFTLSADSVKSGGKVKVVNNASDELNFDSNPHPVHTDNTELNVGDIEPGESKTFTLTTKGTWGFHNHYNSSQRGELTVN